MKNIRFTFAGAKVLLFFDICKRSRVFFPFFLAYLIFLLYLCTQKQVIFDFTTCRTDNCLLTSKARRITSGINLPAKNVTKRQGTTISEHVICGARLVIGCLSIHGRINIRGYLRIRIACGILLLILILTDVVILLL